MYELKNTGVGDRVVYDRHIKPQVINPGKTRTLDLSVDGYRFIRRGQSNGDTLHIREKALDEAAPPPEPVEADTPVPPLAVLAADRKILEDLLERADELNRRELIIQARDVLGADEMPKQLRKVDVVAALRKALDGLDGAPGASSPAGAE